MTIKEILDQISSEPGSNKKIEILTQYKDNKIHDCGQNLLNIVPIQSVFF